MEGIGRCARGQRRQRQCMLQEQAPSLVEDGVRFRIRISLIGNSVIQLSLASNTGSYFLKARCPSETLNEDKIYPECETSMACTGLFQRGRFCLGPRLPQGAGGRAGTLQ